MSKQLSVALLALTAIVAFASAPTSAGVASTGTVATYCSASGDVCYGIFNRSGEVLLRITTAAHYFNRYTLCVRLLPPGPSAENAQRCGAFPLLRRSGSTWGSAVNFVKQFVGPASHPSAPRPGRYKVTWRQVCSRCTPREQHHSARGSALGPALFFRLPLS
jgi:hypothetical protein